MLATFNFDEMVSMLQIKYWHATLLHLVSKLIEMLSELSIFIRFTFRCRNNETKTEDVPLKEVEQCLNEVEKFELTFYCHHGNIDFQRYC